MACMGLARDSSDLYADMYSSNRDCQAHSSSPLAESMSYTSSASGSGSSSALKSSPEQAESGLLLTALREAEASTAAFRLDLGWLAEAS